jgi:hypothetical protein
MRKLEIEMANLAQAMENDLAHKQEIRTFTGNQILLF